MLIQGFQVSVLWASVFDSLLQCSRAFGFRALGAKKFNRLGVRAVGLTCSEVWAIPES